MATILPDKLPKIAYPILIGIAILILLILTFYSGWKYYKSNQEPEIADTNNYENMELENFLASNGKQNCQMNGGPHTSNTRYVIITLFGNKMFMLHKMTQFAEFLEYMITRIILFSIDESTKIRKLEQENQTLKRLIKHQNIPILDENSDVIIDNGLAR